MSTTHQDKSKPRERSRKTDRRGQRPDQQSPELNQRDEDQIPAIVASTDTPTNVAAAPELPSSAAPAAAGAPLIGQVAPEDASIAAIAPADSCPSNIQTIADAYRDCTKNSFQETSSIVEKLMGVHSFDKAIEVQTEFARQAYANFVAESLKIFELYIEFAKQIFRPWEGFAAQVTPSRMLDLTTGTRSQ